MVSAELSHNPYLLETLVLFNGHGPRVNSAIRKYEHLSLAEWIDEVPQIFRDEMNGYGFDLLFTGTDADFEGIKREFNASQVPEESVRVLRKGSLEGPTEKMERVLALLEWLGEDYNPHLELEPLLADNPSLVDASFPLLSIHGENEGQPRSRISLEEISAVSVLDDSDLSYTPMIVNITLKNVNSISEDILHLLNRKDVNQRQLFFNIHRPLNEERVTRVLSDLGIQNPQVVSSVNDPVIIEYVRGFLVVDYVRNAIAVFDNEIARIEAELQEASSRGKLSSILKGGRIRDLDNEIAQLEDTDDILERRSLIESPREYAQAKQAVREAIASWKSRKRRLEGEADARLAEDDLERTIRLHLDVFISSLTSTSYEALGRIDSELAEVYVMAGIDTEYRPQITTIAFPSPPPLPDLRDKLLALNETMFVEQRRDFFGLFGNSSSAGEGEVEITVYHLDKWRIKALEMMEPVLSQLISAHKKSLRSYQKQVTEAYRNHIAELISDRNEKRSQMVTVLSDDERVMQSDNDWLTSLKGRLQDIKRG